MEYRDEIESRWTDNELLIDLTGYLVSLYNLAAWVNHLGCICSDQYVILSQLISSTCSDRNA